MYGQVDPYALLRDGKRVWVRNMTNPLGVLTVGLTENSSFTVPKTKDPICLNDMAPEKALLGSEALRKFLRIGALIVVPEETAAEYYRVSGRRPQDAFRPAQLPDVQEEAMKRDLGIKDIPSPSGPQAMTPSVIHTCMSLQNEKLTDQQIIDYLGQVWGSFTGADINYIMANVTRPAVVAWMASNIASQRVVSDILSGGTPMLSNAPRPEPNTPSVVAPDPSYHPPVSEAQEPPVEPPRAAQTPPKVEVKAKPRVKPKAKLRVKPRRATAPTVAVVARKRGE